MKTYTKPPFVMAYPADMQGCGHHRVIMPLSALSTAGLVDGRLDLRVWSPQEFEIAKPDIIVWQRQIEEIQIELMAGARKACPDAFIVYEIDDNLAAVPEKSHHRPMLPPPDVIEQRISRALEHCDAATTTTPAMAEWLTKLGAKDVRIIPNLTPLTQVRPRQPQGEKLRIGFGGGISHSGDLALIEDAINSIGDEVQWVFLGTKPDGKLNVNVEFHDGVPPQQYLDKLYSLNLDLIVAPLESNHFNDCKSNLRLVEAGACGVPVIAQDCKTYRYKQPPVYRYVPHGYGSQAWTDAIRDFIKAPALTRQTYGNNLQEWVRKHFTFEIRMQDRLEAWLPKGAKPFRPRSTAQSRDRVIFACPAGQLGIGLPPGEWDIKNSLVEACEESLMRGGDVVWMRPGTFLSQDMLDRLRAVKASNATFATVMPLSSDGVNAFPKEDAYTPMPPVMATTLDSIVKEDFAGEHGQVPVPFGPCVLISGAAIARLGIPDVAGAFGSEEAALIEWGTTAEPRMMKHIQTLDVFVASMAPPSATNPAHAKRLELRNLHTFTKPAEIKLSPWKRENLELKLIAREWKGVRPGAAGFKPDYKTWMALQPPRVAEAQPDWPTVAVIGYGETPPLDADWVVVKPDNVELMPDAVDLFRRAAAENRGAGVIYGDHDVFAPDGTIIPDFKPSFDFELALGRDYLTQVIAFRHGIFFGPWRDANDVWVAVMGYAQHLRDDARGGSSKTLHNCIVHLPFIMGHMSVISQQEAEKRAAQRVEAVNGMLPSRRASLHRVPGLTTTDLVLPAVPPKVSIIVPTKGGGWMLQPCLNTVLEHTDYPDFEVLVVHNGEAAMPELGPKAGSDPRVKVIRWSEPYNWSKLNNDAIKEAQGTVLCLLNDDTRVQSKDWLRRMVALALEEDVGAVGLKLIYPIGQIQHIGVVSHMYTNGHVHKNLPGNNPGYWGLAVLTHENNAQTGACLVVRKELFDEVGGLREDLKHNYNDVAFCLELRKRGYRNPCICDAEMMHMEGATRSPVLSAEGQQHLANENRIMAENYAMPDPYWNPNFELGSDGTFVTGLNFDKLRWMPEVAEGAERVLIINDDRAVDHGLAANMARIGRVVFTADLSGFALKLDGPELQTQTAWDVRHTPPLVNMLQRLGIHQVLLRSLIGQKGPVAVVEFMRAAKVLGVPVTYVASPGDMQSPDIGRLCMVEDIDEVQKYIDENGSIFGYVDAAAWRAAWAGVNIVGSRE